MVISDGLSESQKFRFFMVTYVSIIGHLKCIFNHKLNFIELLTLNLLTTLTFYRCNSDFVTIR